MNKKSDSKKSEILKFINEQISENGFPPTVREICAAVGLKSTSSVHTYLKSLEESGQIHKKASNSRAISLVNSDKKYDSSKSSFEGPETINLPIVGSVAAGQPILAEQNITDYFSVPANFFNIKNAFVLKVKGESMINAGIFDGDYVIVDKTDTARNGDIVVAVIEDSATVKTFYKESNYIRLQPENDTMEPIICHDEVIIVGKVVGLYRKF